MQRTLIVLFLTSTLAAAAPAIAEAQSVDQRQASATQTIDMGVRDGSLTTSEAQQLRNEFAGIARLEDQYRSYGGNLSTAERNDLQARTDLLMRRIDYYRGNNDSASTYTNSPGINNRQASLDARIDAGVRDGTLTQAEAARIRAEYQDIAQLEANYRASGRYVTPAERADLDRRFDQLSSRIQNNRNDNDRAGPGINERQASLDARIDAGVRDGTLTQAEAARIRAEYQDIAQLEGNYRSSGRYVTPAERADLDRRFDQLSSRIQNNRNDNDRAGPGINERQASLDARIDAGIRDRTLTQAEAARIRAEYQDIAQLEANYRSSGRSVTPAERADLDRRFDQLSNRILDNRSNNDGRWTNLDQRQAQFNDRLNRAVSDRRVTQQVATNLRSEFNSIARLEARYRQSRPGITDAERNDLNARFDRLETNYRYSINNSSYGDNKGQYQSLFDFLFGIVSR